MKTDKQSYQIIQVCPELINELARLPSPGSRPTYLTPNSELEQKVREHYHR